MSNPAFPILLPPEFHAGMTQQEKTELLIVLRVLAEMVIARPDVQEWWHLPADAIAMLDVQEWCAPAASPIPECPDEVAAHLQKMLLLIETTCRNLKLDYWPLITVIFRHYVREWGSEDGAVVHWAWDTASVLRTVQFVERHLGTDRAFALARKIAEVRRAPSIPPLYLALSDIGPEEARRRREKAADSFIKNVTALAAQELSATQRYARLSQRITRFQNAVATIHAASPGPARKDGELKAKYFYRRYADGEDNTFKLGKELERERHLAPGARRGESTVRKYIDSVKKMLTHKAAEM